MKGLVIFIGLLLLPFLVHSQDLEKVKNWFYDNYREIKNDQEISEFLRENQEIKERLDNYYYGMLAEKHKENESVKKMLEAKEIDLTSIEAFLSDDVFRMIEEMYWKIANSSTKDKVAEVILKEMTRAKEKLAAEIRKMPVQKQ